MSRPGPGSLVAVLLMALAPAGARAELRIIDVNPQPRPNRPKGPAAAPAAPAVPDVQLVTDGSETSRNLSAGVVAQLTALGYSLGPEVDIERLKPNRTAKVVMRLDIVRMGGTCIITAKAAELKTPTIYFWRWETKDDSQSCTEQLKAVVEAFNRERAPSKTPPDAGMDLDATVHLPARIVLAPTLVEPEIAELAIAPDAAAEAPDTGAPVPKKKGCGCASAGEPALVLGALALALRRHREAGSSLEGG